METKRQSPSKQRWFALLIGILIPIALLLAVAVSASPGDEPQPQFTVQVQDPSGQPITAMVRIISGEDVINAAPYIPTPPVPFGGFEDGEHLLIEAWPMPENVPALANSQRKLITVTTPNTPPVYTLRLQRPNITGTVLAPNGDPLPPISDPGTHEPWPQAVVHLRDENGPFRLDVETTPAGDFSLAVPPYPHYQIGASPNPVYSYTQSFPKHIKATSTTIFVSITLTIPAFEGQILDPQGNVFTPCLSIWLENLDGDPVDETWACDGYYRLGGVPMGDYRILAESLPEMGMFAPSPISVNFHGQQREIHNIHLQYPQLEVYINDPSGTPAPGEVEMYTPDGDPLWRQGIISGQPAIIGGMKPDDYCFIAWPAPSDIPNLANSGRMCVPILTPTATVPSITLQLLEPTAVGVVKDPEGNPLPPIYNEEGALIAPATVIVHDIMTGDIKLMVQTNISGEFSFALPRHEEYEFLARPNGTLASFLSKSKLHTFSYLPGAVLPINLGEVRLTRPRIVGIVQKPNGSLVSTQVHIWNDSDTYYDDTWYDAYSGLDFVFGGMPEGHYYVQADPPPLWVDPMGWGPSNAISFTVPPTYMERITLTLRMPNVTGQVCFPPLPSDPTQPCDGPEGIDVHIFSSDYEDWGSTREEGRYVFGGLPAENYTIEFFLPPHLTMDWRPPIPVTFTLKSPDEHKDLGQLPLRPADKTKILQGWVKDNNGTTIGDARVIAWREGNGVVVEKHTTSNGTYSMTLGGGVWQVGVKPDHPGTNWYFDPDDEQWVTFPCTPSLIITRTAFFTVTDLTEALQVTGIITSPDSSDIPPDSVFAHLCTDEGQCFSAPAARNGKFLIRILPGSYTFKVDLDPELGWAPPVHNDFHVAVEDENINLGLFQLRDRTNPNDMVRLSGRIIVTGTNMPRGLGGVAVTAWTDEGDWAEAQTITTGFYSLLIYPGHWHGGPSLTDEQRESYIVLPPRVKSGYLEAGEVISNVNFYVRERDATIRGRVVAVGSQALITDTEVFISAEVCNTNECYPVDDAVSRGGFFQLNVLGGYTYTLSSHVPDGGYMPGPPVNVHVNANDTTTTTLGLLEAGTRIYGYIIDQDLNEVQIDASVYGSDSDGLYYVEDYMWPEKPDYTLNVPTPDDHTVTWTLQLRVPPETGYIPDPGHSQYQVEIQQGIESVPQILYVKKLDAIISGTVMMGAGQPAKFVTVFIEGQPDSDCADIYFETTTDENGDFSTPVLPCRYNVGAYLPPHMNDRFFPPDPQPWTSLDDNPITLNFRPIKGIRIRGALTLRDENGQTVMLPGDDEITVLGWSDDAGNRVVTGTPASGYFMPVISQTTWHLWAVYEDVEHNRIYASEEETVDVGEDPIIDKNLILTLQSESLPDPICETFDPSYFYRFSLPAYGHLPAPLIEIPAGAMPVTDTVEICATPKRAVARGKQLIGFGYELIARNSSGQPITEDFNKSIRLIFYYNQDAIGERDPTQLQPAFYSTTRQEWVALTDVYIDPEDQFVTGKTDHFTDFGLLSAESGTATQYNLYLPLIVRNR